ncbi:MAG: glycosyltransferase [Pseudobutyrivibrio sp.]|nr:glycosyltransferase [Pseudobutyrivibrio sp.]
MKKICYITTVPMTIKAFILESAEYLHKNTDWDITFICDEDEEFAANLPEYIHYHPIKMTRGISLDGITAMMEMKKIFREKQFDLIQYSTPNASFYAAIAGKMEKVPVRLYCQWGMAYVGFTGLKRMIFKSIEKYVCKNSTWIEPDSKSNLQFSHKEGLYPEDKGSVIWNGSACGVKLDKFDVEHKSEWRHIIREKHAIPSDAFVYGFVGRATRDKGINELLSAAKTILAKYSNTYLVFVGPEEADVTINADLLAWAKADERVIFAGYSNIVEQYLSAMDVYILPSYREGFGMGVVEAEAMAVPVIVTNIPGPIDAMVKDVTGFVIEKKSVSDLQDAMETIMYLDVKSMGQAGLEFARNEFGQEEFFNKLLEDRKKLLKC